MNERAAANYVIYAFVGFFLGKCLANILMKRFNVSSFIRIIIYIFIALNGFMTQIISWTGLFDIAFDYRKKFNGKR